MKILQLGKFYPLKGGVEIVMYELAKGLSERDIDCDLLYASGDGQTAKICLNKHCSIYRSKTLVEAKATMISPSMIRILRKIAHNYDIIHIHHPDPMAALALRCSGFRGKVVLHWHSDIVRQNRLLTYYRPLQNWLIKRADVIVGTSPVYLRESPELKDVQSKTFCIPIGINEPNSDDEKTALVQAQYAGKKIVFSLGRLVLYKGFEYLIDAAKLLTDDYVVLIGGKGHQHDYLSQKIANEGLQDKVKLVGFIPDDMLHAYFNACKVFCLSSIDKREAFAIVQIEAMAHGKPVVSVDIPGSGVPWVNRHGVSGINVPPRDSRHLAEAIMQLCSDELTYQQYCRQSRQHFEELFRKDNMISTSMEMYHGLLTGDMPADKVSSNHGQTQPQEAPHIVLRIKDNLKLRQVGSSYFIVDSGKENIDFTDIFVLNREAAFLWNEFQHCEFTPRAMADRLCTKFDVGRETAEHDVVEMLNLWNAFGLLQ